MKQKPEAAKALARQRERVFRLERAIESAERQLREHPAYLHLREELAALRRNLEAAQDIERRMGGDAGQKDLFA